MAGTEMMSAGPWNRVARLLLTLVLAAGIGGCTIGERRVVPEDLIGQVTVNGLSGIRFWADEFDGDPEAITREFAENFRQYNIERGRRIDMLAISGGGQNGAYTAGLLNGWTRAGNRPAFDLVTGISTGSIIAPFAFLGPRHDRTLREIYTTVSNQQLGKAVIGRGFATEGVMDASRFEALIAKYTSEAMLDEIAAEGRKGRLLLLGTTNLEAERGVIWNITALAASGNPNRLDLFRKIVRASASIPGAYPPVRIKVEHAGDSFEELHVDGGVAEQVFLYPPQISARSLDKHLGYVTEKNLYVIRNGKLTPEYRKIEDNTLKIAERSVSMLIKMQGIGNVRRIADLAARDGIRFKVASIPASFNEETEEFFDPAYTVPLYRVGLRDGLSQEAWTSRVP